MKFKLIAKATEIITAKDKKEADDILGDYVFNNLFDLKYKIIEVKKVKK